MRKSVQVGLGARRTCPCVGVLCFLCAFIASLFGAKTASADAPVPAAAAIKKTTPLAAPAAMLGLTNPYVVAAALKRPAVAKPRIIDFTFSDDLVDLVQRVEKLAVHGVELNQRRLSHTDKLNLRVQSRLGGGVLQLYYRR
jgi:hypothetical protein